jgi:hypothetical protein
MIKMKKMNKEMFTGLEVMKFALENNLWTTKQTTEKQLMTTWAFYLKTLKEIGVKECGSVGSAKSVISINDLLELEDEAEDEDAELERLMKEEAEAKAAE